MDTSQREGSQRKDDLMSRVDALFMRHVYARLRESGQVFCEACWYFDTGADVECTHEHAVVRKRTWQREETSYTPPSIRNAHNDCRDFHDVTLGRPIAKQAWRDRRMLIPWLIYGACLAAAFCVVSATFFAVMWFLELH